MATTTEKIKLEIEKIEQKKNKAFFFVYDTKGAPSGSLAYIYRTAYFLIELGYDVRMLYADEDFVGVGSWLGEKYSNLPHYNVKDGVAVSPADTLFIPEICVGVMTKTKDYPCKRVVILQNFSFLIDAMPMGVSFRDLKIGECITTSNAMAERILKSFPYMKINIVRPSIPDYFLYESEEPKQLIINVVAKDNLVLNSIIKPFYWKYPMYAWVGFRPIANLPREEFAEALREGFATIWYDGITDFGYSAIESMACRSIVIGKVPENAPEWMETDEGLQDNGVWFYNTEHAQDLIAGLIQSFLTDSIPSIIYENMEKTASQYTERIQDADIQKVYEGYFNERKKELQIALDIENSGKDNEEKNAQ